MKGFYFITDEILTKRGNVKDVEIATSLGCQVIQYRNKKNNSKKMYQEALELKEIIKSINKETKFLINDRVDIALAVDADGVHIGQEDLPISIVRKLLPKNKIIGISIHSIEEVKEAIFYNVDYVGVGPVYKTLTEKDDGEPLGLQLLKDIKNYINLNKLKIPIVAIGGIKLNNVKEVILNGADMVSAISDTVQSDDMSKTIKEYQEKFF